LDPGAIATIAVPIVDGPGPAEIFKDDAGTLVLSGTNNYTGGTTVAQGTLVIGNGGASGSIVGNITDNAQLAFNRSDTLTFAGAITGSGSLTQSGNGTLILTGASTYTGGTTINAGILQIGDGGTAGGSMPAGLATGSI
jgi:fibronectin-binding autotransporter adhesin